MPDLALQKPLEDVADYLEKMSSRTIPLLLALCDDGVSFSDPYRQARGRDSLGAAFAARLSLYPDLKIRVHQICWTRVQYTAHLEWTMVFSSRKSRLLKPASIQRHEVGGLSKVLFSPDGHVYSLDEFWGAHHGFDSAAYHGD